MAHGRSAYHRSDDDGKDDQVGLKDVEVPGGFIGLSVIKVIAYGWSRARARAWDKKRKRLREYVSADNNSDTLALFASGV
jgi:hypothetical protein